MSVRGSEGTDDTSMIMRLFEWVQDVNESRKPGKHHYG
jgi:hypothetical protein